MVNINNKHKDPENENLISFLYRWRKGLFRIGVAAVLVSTVVSFLIQPKYKATVVLFPATSSSISKSLMSSSTDGIKHDLLQFGEEVEAEQMLQVLKSDQIRDRITGKYDLFTHYDIDSTEEFRFTKLFDEYEDNISFERTEYMSVRISVLDKDPLMAANIANDIAALLDSAQDRIEKDRARQALTIIDFEYKRLQDEVREIHDSLKVLREMGINDYETESSVFNEQYAKALATNNRSAVEALKTQLKILSQFGGAYVQLRQNEELRLTRLNQLKEKLEEVKVDAEQTLPHKFVVNSARPPERKTYPIRWLIIITSTMATLLISVLVMMAVENIDRLRSTK